MMTEYIILGAVLVVMGAVQMWLRWGPWAKEQRQADQALAARRTEAAQSSTDGETDDDGASESGRSAQPVIMPRGTKLWTKWTAILGPLGMGLGLALLIWGIVGE